MERIIEYTADGSATLFVPELDEHYHSVKGALTESSHIFIDMGLKTSAAPSPRILEIGFGTGLNALLTLIEAEKSGRQVHYTGIELYPLPWETVEKLGYTNEEQSTISNEQAAQWMKALHTSPWGEDVRITSQAWSVRRRSLIIHRPSLIIHRYSPLSTSTLSRRRSSRRCGRKNYSTACTL